MSNLADQITFLANGLVEGILEAVRTASFDDVLADWKNGNRFPGNAHVPFTVNTNMSANKVARSIQQAVNGRLPRRSPADLEKVVGLVVGALGKAKEGLRSEQLQQALSLSKKEIVGPLSLALSTKKIVKKGNKRATTYFVKTRAKVVKKVAAKAKAKPASKKKAIKKSLKVSKKKS